MYIYIICVVALKKSKKKEDEEKQTKYFTKINEKKKIKNLF